MLYYLLYQFDFVKWLVHEFQAVFLILAGIIMMAGGMFISDIPTAIRDHFYQKKG